MDTKNVLMAVILSTMIIVGWQVFVVDPDLKKEKTTTTIQQKDTQQSNTSSGKPTAPSLSAKKLGNAVKRNRIRRRLKMAARKAIEEMKTSFNKKVKYAIFAKAKVYDVDFQIIVNELIKKFKEVKYH